MLTAYRAHTQEDAWVLEGTLTEVHLSLEAQTRVKTKSSPSPPAAPLPS